MRKPVYSKFSLLNYRLHILIRWYPLQNHITTPCHPKYLSLEYLGPISKPMLDHLHFVPNWASNTRQLEEHLKAESITWIISHIGLKLHVPAKNSSIYGAEAKQRSQQHRTDRAHNSWSVQITIADGPSAWISPTIYRHGCLIGFRQVPISQLLNTCTAFCSHQTISLSQQPEGQNNLTLHGEHSTFSSLFTSFLAHILTSDKDVNFKIKCNLTILQMPPMLPTGNMLMSGLNSS